MFHFSGFNRAVTWLIGLEEISFASLLGAHRDQRRTTVDGLVMSSALSQEVTGTSLIFFFSFFGSHGSYFILMGRRKSRANKSIQNILDAFLLCLASPSHMTQGTKLQLDSDWYLKPETFICADLKQRLKTALTTGWCGSFKPFHWYWWFFSLFLLGNWTLRAASCGRWQNTGESLGCDMKNLWAAPLWIQLKTFRFFFPSIFAELLPPLSFLSSSF